MTEEQNQENKNTINIETVYEIKDGYGFVKEYNNEGKIIFVGEYLNGERN